jgi:hypothetical protein
MNHTRHTRHLGNVDRPVLYVLYAVGMVKEQCEAYCVYRAVVLVNYFLLRIQLMAERKENSKVSSPLMEGEASMF